MGVARSRLSSPHRHTSPNQCYGTPPSAGALGTGSTRRCAGTGSAFGTAERCNSGERTWARTTSRAASTGPAVVESCFATAPGTAECCGSGAEPQHDLVHRGVVVVVGANDCEVAFGEHPQAGDVVLG